jgi:hypothetical protein
MIKDPSKADLFLFFELKVHDIGNYAIILLRPGFSCDTLFTVLEAS